MTTLQENKEKCRKKTFLHIAPPSPASPHLLNYHQLFHSSLVWSVDASGVCEDRNVSVLQSVWLCVCQMSGGSPRLPRPLASRLG